jgi:hypothetical protein
MAGGQTGENFIENEYFDTRLGLLLLPEPIQLLQAGLDASNSLLARFTCSRADLSNPSFWSKSNREFVSGESSPCRPLLFIVQTIRELD